MLLRQLYCEENLRSVQRPRIQIIPDMIDVLGKLFFTNIWF